jgi:hypothetical protein
MLKFNLLISNFILLKNFKIWLNQWHVNRKSHVSQPTTIVLGQFW